MSRFMKFECTQSTYRTTYSISKPIMTSLSELKTALDRFLTAVDSYTSSTKSSSFSDGIESSIHPDLRRAMRIEVNSASLSIVSRHSPSMNCFLFTQDLLQGSEPYFWNSFFLRSPHRSRGWRWRLWLFAFFWSMAIGTSHKSRALIGRGVDRRALLVLSQILMCVQPIVSCFLLEHTIQYVVQVHLHGSMHLRSPAQRLCLPMLQSGHKKETADPMI